MGSKIGLKRLLELDLVDLVFDLVIGWSQNSSKTVQRGLLGGSWVVLGGLGAVLGRSWPALGGSLGPFWTVLGGLWAVLRVSWGILWDSWALVLLLMRFVDSIC